MNEATKNITKETFPVFKKLMEEVILKATNKPVEANPAIGEVFSKKANRFIKQIPESKAREIIIKITNETLEEDNRGRRLQSLINAALNNDANVNARIYTLNLLAEYVLKNNIEQPVKNRPLNWKSYIENNKQLFSTANSVAVSKQRENISANEIAEVSIIDNEFISGTQQYELLLPLTSKVNFQPSYTTESGQAEADLSPSSTGTKKFIAAGIWGGIYAGIIVSVIIAITRYINGNTITPFSTGYENVSFGYFMQYIFTPLLLFHIASGAFLGWLCCYAAVAKNKLLNKVALFVISFIAFVVLRQSMARDAWYVPGTYLIYDTHHQLIRKGGGYLGEPDFETLATALMNTTVMLTIVKIFRRKKYSVPTTKEALGILVKVTIYGILTWCLVYCLYLILVIRLGALHKNSYFISSAIFTFDFPHPERVTTATFFCIIYLYGTIASIQYHAPAKEFKN